MKYKLVSKFCDNWADIVLVTVSGEMRTIARIEFPADAQQLDNNNCVEEIMKALYKRLRKSI
ncbi:MAG: hypothetical protein IKO16_05750 [Lachnospiraceae bacterium]|nr:hypothetical protein [Lachnospiraceae bacterium]